MATLTGKRPFWMHQIAEYIVAAAFIAQGLQASTPGVPAVLGGLVLLNAACAKGAAAAFRIFSIKQHKYLDLALVALIVIAAVQPVVDLDSNTRVIMGVLVFVLLFVWWGSDFNPPVKREMPKSVATGLKVAGSVKDAIRRPVTTTFEPSAPKPAPATSKPTAASKPATPPKATADRADQFGRAAGKLAGKGMKAYRARKDRKP